MSFLPSSLTPLFNPALPDNQNVVKTVLETVMLQTSLNLAGYRLANHSSVTVSTHAINSCLTLSCTKCMTVVLVCCTGDRAVSDSLSTGPQGSDAVKPAAATWPLPVWAACSSVHHVGRRCSRDCCCIYWSCRLRRRAACSWRCCRHSARCWLPRCDSTFMYPQAACVSAHAHTCADVYSTSAADDSLSYLDPCNKQKVNLTLSKILFSQSLCRAFSCFLQAGS